MWNHYTGNRSANRNAASQCACFFTGLAIVSWTHPTTTPSPLPASSSELTCAVKGRQNGCRNANWGSAVAAFLMNKRKHYGALHLNHLVPYEDDARVWAVRLVWQWEWDDAGHCVTFSRQLNSTLKDLRQESNVVRFSFYRNGSVVTRRVGVSGRQATSTEEREQHRTRTAFAGAETPLGLIPNQMYHEQLHLDMSAAELMIPLKLTLYPSSVAGNDWTIYQAVQARNLLLLFSSSLMSN